ncbi:MULTISPECIES: LysR family transcriptional regulator [Ramlibacter]|uniref:LysR family transcriptional regulator n=1 Tax=Ramlibacter pinisoli TaxID=2682844 RepID=A0A6N8IR84_9BURK|nr:MULTISPECIES: LysR family transcriptional regulator [Ramlibacter]MBA2964391.1 LysR family transcriptional regulator [Ramlibacter sp. CGMCC 1.13660]MVQ29357.1 LysR family transcriptional regulator [Ramlibacter pinisoli]
MAQPPATTPPADLFRRLRIKSRQIMLLDALDAHRNLRRAAAAIHTTQPAATTLLQQLEEGLGVPLFERHARGMEPTLYGEVMIRYARSVLHDFEHAGDEMAALVAGQAGLVRIGTVMGAMPVLLTEALARFKDGHPRVRVTLQVDTSDLLIPALVRGDLDVALGRLPDQFEGGELEIETMEGEAMAVVARPGHALFDRADLQVADLVAETWILHPTGSPMRRRIEQALQEASMAPPPDIVETSSILATTALLESTDMVSVVPLDVARHYANYGMLAILPVELPISMAKLGILTRKQKDLSPAVRAFLRTLQECSAERTAAGR